MKLVETLRELNPAKSLASYKRKRTFGERTSDSITAIVGAWRFLIIQSVILLIWVGMNITGYVQHWDPYPFILLNLFLSFQAAYTAPIILMSQNREAGMDRDKLEYYYKINLKQELEIELLHEKIDELLSLVKRT
jgi:uncharacterized membrane protein